MNDLATLLDWFDRDDERFRSAAVTQLAARHALQVHEGRDSGPLTPFGIASCAASMAVVLATSHANHLLVIERLRRERDESE